MLEPILVKNQHGFIFYVFKNPFQKHKRSRPLFSTILYDPLGFLQFRTALSCLAISTLYTWTLGMKIG
jgi:hypothetical protein